jgi:hypothetical protein
MINTNNIIPVLPYKYAVIPNDTVTLIASTGDPLNQQNFDYYFEIDTTDLFSNPVNSGVINQKGGIVKWKVPYNLTDSIVYYWRVGIKFKDTIANWVTSSFQYIKNTTGWGQAHFYQFKNNQYDNLKYNYNDRNFQFTNDVKSIFCKTAAILIAYLLG